MLKERLDCIKFNMLNIAHKFTKAHIGDLIIDFDKLERVCYDNDKLVFIARRCGCELGNYGDDRIRYFIEPLKERRNNDIIVYEIDMDGISNADLMYCYDLIEMGYMKRVFVNETYEGEI